MNALQVQIERVKAARARMGMAPQRPVVVIPREPTPAVIAKQQNEIKIRRMKVIVRSQRWKPPVAPTNQTPDDLLVTIEKTPTLAEIRRGVAAHFEIPELEIVSQRRTQAVVTARQLAMYLCRELTMASFPQIGRSLHRDHTTALHGVAVTETRVKNDPEFALLVEEIKAKLSGAASAHSYWGA
jgi:hypothetical protein